MSSDPDRLDTMREYYAKHRAFPSMQRLAQLLGYRSTSAVSAFVDRLSEEGFLARTEGGRVAPGKRFFDRPLSSGRVPAGRPIDVEDLGSAPTRIDELLVRHPARAFIVRVQGESMKDVGLMPGDYVVAERDSLCEPGDVVVAHVDGEFTVKILAGRPGRYYLKAANPQFADIVPADRLQIAGLVVAAFRKMH